MVEKFLLKMLVENNRGVMARIATLLARKGYNITSISVGSQNDGEATIVLSIWGTPNEVEGAKNTLGKLVNVISIEKYTPEEVIEVEDCLIKLRKTGKTDFFADYNATIVAETNGVIIVRASNHPDKIKGLLERCMKELEVLEFSRSGTNAITIK